MDNLAHSLVGLAAAKAGLDRLSPGATALCVLAANAPDIDVVTALSGKAAFLHYHRGITHSIIGTLGLGLLLPAIYWAGGAAIARVRNRAPAVRFRGLLPASLIVMATHPIMDWSGDYGMRPLLPWSGKWFYGDFDTVVDPFFWLIVGAAAFLLTSDRSLKLIAWTALAVVTTVLVMMATRSNAELANRGLIQAIWVATIVALVIARRLQLPSRFGPRIALASFVLVGLYWSGLGFAHHQASGQATVLATRLAGQQGEHLVRQAVMPTTANPFRWQCVVETDAAIYRFLLNIREGEVVAGGDSKVGRLIELPQMGAGIWRFEKPRPEEERLIEVAARDPQARMFLDFARFPFARPQDRDCKGQTLVAFADLRYNLRSTDPGTVRGTFWLDVPVDCKQK